MLLERVARVILGEEGVEGEHGAVWSVLRLKIWVWHCALLTSGRNIQTGWKREPLGPSNLRWAVLIKTGPKLDRAVRHAGGKKSQAFGHPVDKCRHQRSNTMQMKAFISTGFEIQDRILIGNFKFRIEHRPRCYGNDGVTYNKVEVY